MCKRLLFVLPYYFWCGIVLNTIPVLAQDQTRTSPTIDAVIKALRSEGAAKKWSFVPTHTGVSERTIESLTGELEPSRQTLIHAEEINLQAQNVVKAYKEAL